MNEEEKKAIEKIKELEKLTREATKERNTEETQKLYKEYADYYLILLNLIDKLQKENEELRQNYDIATTEMEELNNRDIKRLVEIGELRTENSYLKQENEYLNCICESDKDNYINKGKIREKIKELEEYIVKTEEETCGRCITIGEDMTIRYLKELLEEE